MQPMNEDLYKRLVNRYKTVKVANEGLATVYQIAYDTEGRPRMVFSQVGEAYRVNCPFCSDMRYRLYVNHLYGLKDVNDRRMTFMAMCWNEDCLANELNRELFYAWISGDSLDRAKVKPGRVEGTGELRKVGMPGPCTKLHHLPTHHEANVYVRGRSFDPELLGKVYGVSYCHNSMYYLARGNLVIPITKGPDLVGWQVRYLGELDWKNKELKNRGELPPKYFTMPGFPKGQWLPNIEKARRHYTGVLVEGFFDVFGAGPMCMPLLGSSLGAAQQKLFLQAFGKRSGVLMLDADVQRDEKKWPKLSESIAALKRQMPLAVVWPPEGLDPGSMDREVTCDIIRQQAKEQGVKVSFGKVA